jgi:hypothetical protein
VKRVSDGFTLTVSHCTETKFVQMRAGSRPSGDKCACFYLVSCLMIQQTAATVLALCNGAKVAYQYNLRPEFHTPVGVAAANALLEMRLCIGSNTRVANVGVQSLSVSVSADGEFPLRFRHPYTVLLKVFSIVFMILAMSYANVYNLTAGPSFCPLDANSSACVAPFGPACHSVAVTINIPFAFVKGSAAGVQFGSTCAFGPTGRPTSIDGQSSSLSS